jgi:hypothetical protein
MKRQPRPPVSEVQLSINQVAVLFDVDRRTVLRWVELGLPRQTDGRFSFPVTGLWINALKHRYDRRCDRHPEQDLMFILARAIQLWPTRVRTIADSQHLLRQLCGFQLSVETCNQIRA